jgi:hypothetical protein
VNIQFSFVDCLLILHNVPSNLSVPTAILTDYTDPCYFKQSDNDFMILSPGTRLLDLLAGSPLFERKSSKQTKCNSFGAIFHILGLLFLDMYCLLPPIPFLFKTIEHHPRVKVQTLSSYLHMTPVLLN